MIAAYVIVVSAMNPSIPAPSATVRCSPSVTMRNSPTIWMIPSTAGVSQPAMVVRMGRRTAESARRERGRTSRNSAYMPIQAARLRKNGASPAP